MAGSGNTVGWKVDRAQRAELLERFPPRYDEAVADHITLHNDRGAGPLPHPVNARIIGRVDDGRGVEAMVAQVDGTTDRPDGSSYHITWSLGPGRRAKQSNDVLREQPWQRFDEPIVVTVEPARF